MFCLIAPTGALPGLHAGPNLQALLRGATELRPVRVDEQDLHSPLERCLSRLRGGPESGALPLAAWRLPASAKATTGLPWALVSPLHIELQASQAVALPQQALQLSAAHSQALFSLLSPLFPAEEGWHQQQLDTLTWALGHEQLAGLQLASLERAVDRPLSPWLPQERWLRRMTNEAQMLLHEHPVNQERVAQGLLPVNTIWWWGAGALQGQPLPENTTVHRPTDWQAADPLLAPWVGAHDFELWLAGERQARGFRIQRRLSLWQRLTARDPQADPILASL
ncbi:MAG: hypothetical protein ACOVN9_06745 [Inhella sp.]